jgi:hypothetical protein
MRVFAKERRFDLLPSCGIREKISDQFPLPFFHAPTIICF